MPAQPLRLAHISDLHLMDQTTRMRLRDWLNKRAVGWTNHRMTRRSVFSQAGAICRHLAETLPTRGLDGVLFTGDATSLGTALEFKLAADIFDPLMAAMPGVAVPGNHDHYVGHSVRGNFFESTFTPWQDGTRVDSHRYPFAREFHGIWFVCVNSSRANLVPWDSRGQVGHRQLERLEQLIYQLPVGPKVLVTHYPFKLANGTPEKRWRRLRDAHRLWDILERDVVYWFHGHRHVRYHLTVPGTKCTEVCVGSTTQEGRWTYHEYTFTRDHLVILQRTWNAAEGRFVDAGEEQLPTADVWKSLWT